MVSQFSIFLCCIRLRKCIKLRYNKAFKSDSQRLAVSLRSSIAKRCSHLNAALGCFKLVRFVVL
ncbi:hypothetical protein CTT30_06230 [Vibrio coralliilyticus]|nr:hypothetical protein CTT30_06230 [Vibrio coralliilyticus]